MEPRPHERGNVTTFVETAERAYLLQWSHVLMNVETVPRCKSDAGRRGGFNGATSS